MWNRAKNLSALNRAELTQLMPRSSLVFQIEKYQSPSQRSGVFET
jgi:hypothetical protein